MEFETGKVLWRNRSVGKGSLTYADGSLYLLGEENTVGLATANRLRIRRRDDSKSPIRVGPVGRIPVVCGGKLFIRNQVCLPVRH